MIAEPPSLPDASPRSLRFGDIYRYPNGADATIPIVGGFPNLHYFTVGANGTKVMLESGINPVAEVPGVDGRRRPMIALRSAPWKAGGESTPWHDVFDLDHGHVRYFGDHKAGSDYPLGQRRGNAALLAAWPAHQGTDRSSRLSAAPIVLFRSATVNGQVKGHVEFCGLALIERLEHVVQRDAHSGRSFANLVYDLAVLDLSAENERLDWRWIDDRRNPALSAESTLRFAPRSWRRWIDAGSGALPTSRRRVAASRIRSTKDQQPVPGTPEAEVLGAIYAHFEGRKHAFELLAARVAAEVLRGRGGTYTEGWITRGSGDGGADFVGRLEVGVDAATTSLVVLGQAKCVAPSTGISAEQIARVVARLQRGWIGVYVTTSFYSRSAQEEIIDDRYPVILIDGATLAAHTRRLAIATSNGELTTFLERIVAQYPAATAHRRPDEVLYG